MYVYVVIRTPTYCVLIMKSQRNATTVNSLLTDLYKADTSVKRTPGVGSVATVFQSFYCN